MSSFLCNDNMENDNNDNDNIYFKLSDIIDNTDNNDIINTIKDKGWAIIVIDTNTNTNTNTNSLFNKNELLSLSSYISIFKKAFDLPSDIKVILILILILIIMMMIIIIILRIHLSFLIREV